MILISDLSESYTKDISASEMSAIVGGRRRSVVGSGSTTTKYASVNITQVAIATGYNSSASNYAFVSISQ
jgi:hypothetical protein